MSPQRRTREAAAREILRLRDAVLEDVDAERVPVEDAVVEEDRPTASDAPAGQHVVERGSVVAAGETALEAGRRLAPRDAAVLAGLGRDEGPVRRRLSAALLATGDRVGVVPYGAVES